MQTNTFVLVNDGGQPGKEAAISQGGAVWTAEYSMPLIPSSGSATAWKGIAYGSAVSMWVAVPVGAAYVGTSTDGQNWAQVAAPLGDWSAVTWAPSLNIFVAVAKSGAAQSMVGKITSYLNVVGDKCS